jgi:glycyl-tRNA synthetase (class II)
MSEESKPNILKKEKDITSYLKQNGFLLPNAEIYGGLANS